MKIVFWLCVLGALYSYFLYPALLMLATVGKRTRAAVAAPRPQCISIIIAARNEAGKIANKIHNTLDLERPAYVDLQILVASDASDDDTDRIVREFSGRGVVLVRSPERQGKEQAQGLAIFASRGDLIVFTDAGTILQSDALHHLLAAFADSSVGAVSSVDRFITDDGAVHGEGLYVRYEMALRDLETRLFSLVGLSGSFFAARRLVCQDWDTHVPSDFGTALNCVRAGLRAVSDRRVIGYYRNISDPAKEYQRKVRTVSRGMMGLKRRSEVLNPARFGIFAFQVFSHKVMRWAVPWFLLGALVTSVFLARHDSFYVGLLIVQALFYLLPLLVKAVPVLMRLSPVRLAVFFLEVNVAIVAATVALLKGQRTLTWEPSKR